MKKSAPQGSHCGGEETIAVSDPPQAENPALQDPFFPCFSIRIVI